MCRGYLLYAILRKLSVVRWSSQRSLRGHSTTSMIMCRLSSFSLGSTETAILELPYIVYEGLLAESAKNKYYVIIPCRTSSVSHLTYGASVRPENTVTYLAGNEGQNACGDLPETTVLKSYAAKHERKRQYAIYSGTSDNKPSQ